MEKRILLCIPGTYIAGAEMTNIETLKVLKSKGYHLHCIINGWNDGTFKEILLNEGIGFTEVKVGAFYIRKIWWTLDTLLNFIPGVFKFFITYKKFNPDIIFFSGKWHYYVFARWLKNVKIIYREHGFSDITKRNIAFFSLLNHTANTIIVDSIFIKINLNQLNVIKPAILVAPSLVNDQSDYVPGFKIIEKINIAIVGQVLENKGHDVLVKALSLLNNEDLKKLHLIIIGRTYEPYTSEIKAWIGQQSGFCEVTWTGKLDSKENFYKTYGIDLVIVPSRIEAFGRVALEPAFSAIPVIASRTGGLCEIVKHGETGFLFETENIKELAGYIEQYLGNRDLMRKHGLFAKENAIVNFSYEALSKKTLLAFE